MDAKEEFGFKELIVWQKAIQFAAHVILVLDKIDSSRKHYRVIEQTAAAVTSISANIAEGKGRFSKKEFKQFLYIARGSMYETISFLNLMVELNWIKIEAVHELEKEGLTLNKMINSLINKLKTDI
jgi:four helix bundle protein